MAKRNTRFRVTATIDVVVEGGSPEAALERIRQMCIDAKIPIRDMKVKEDTRVRKPQKGDPAVTKKQTDFLEPPPKKAPKRRKGPQLGLGFK